MAKENATHLAFKGMDANNDGVVTKREFLKATKAADPAAAKSEYGAWKSHQDGTAAFKSADANGDGIVSDLEFAAAQAGSSPAEYTARQREERVAYAVLDCNGDGIVTKREFLLAATAADPAAGKGEYGAWKVQRDALAAFNAADKDGDGVVTNAEFRATRRTARSMSPSRTHSASNKLRDQNTIAGTAAAASAEAAQRKWEETAWIASHPDVHQAMRTGSSSPRARAASPPRPAAPSAISITTGPRPTTMHTAHQLSLSDRSVSASLGAIRGLGVGASWEQQHPVSRQAAPSTAVSATTALPPRTASAMMAPSPRTRAPPRRSARRLMSTNSSQARHELTSAQNAARAQNALDAHRGVAGRPTQCTQSFSSSTSATAQVAVAFQNIDRNGDGAITKNEFLKAARTSSSVTNMSRTTDGGRDAVLSMKGWKSEREAESRFAHMDNDGDGVVSRDEFAYAADATVDEGALRRAMGTTSPRRSPRAMSPTPSRGHDNAAKWVTADISSVPSNGMMRTSSGVMRTSSGRTVQFTPAPSSAEMISPRATSPRRSASPTSRRSVSSRDAELARRDGEGAPGFYENHHALQHTSSGNERDDVTVSSPRSSASRNATSPLRTTSYVHSSHTARRGFALHTEDTKPLRAEDARHSNTTRAGLGLNERLDKLQSTLQNLSHSSSSSRGRVAAAARDEGTDSESEVFEEYSSDQAHRPAAVTRRTESGTTEAQMRAALRARLEARHQGTSTEEAAPRQSSESDEEDGDMAVPRGRSASTQMRASRRSAMASYSQPQEDAVSVGGDDDIAAQVERAFEKARQLSQQAERDISPRQESAASPIDALYQVSEDEEEEEQEEESYTDRRAALAERQAQAVTRSTMDVATSQWNTGGSTRQEIEARAARAVEDARARVMSQPKPTTGSNARRTSSEAEFAYAMSKLTTVELKVPPPARPLSPVLDVQFPGQRAAASKPVDHGARSPGSATRDMLEERRARRKARFASKKKEESSMFRRMYDDSSDSD